MEKKQLLGITGFARSGKTELIRYLTENHGYHVVSASGIIRKNLEEETGRARFSRDELLARGNILRQTFGADFVIKAGLEAKHSKIVFDGVRNLSAQQTLFVNGGYMIGLVALANVRYERGNSAIDNKVHPSSVEEMLKQEAHDLNSTDKNGLHLLPVLWNIPPEAIIDTTSLSIVEVIKHAEQILRAYESCARF